MFLKKETTLLSSFIALLTLVILLVISSACDKSPETDKKEVPKNNAKINITTEKLPINFKGDDIAEIYNRLKNSKPPSKGEYETTEEYKIRKEAIYQSLLQDNTLYFIQGNKLSYDADKMKYFTSLRLKDTYINNTMAVNISEVVVKSKYVAQNAFGMSMQISLEECTKYGLIITNREEIIKIDLLLEKRYEQGKQWWRNYDMDIELPMPIEKAKQLSVNALFVCKLKPFGIATNYNNIGEKSTRKEPSINSPFDLQYHYYYISTELLSIWIYDMNSGEIIAKYKPLFVFDKTKSNY